MLVTNDKLDAEPGYHNRSPLLQLIVLSSEATVVVEGVEMMALVDTGSKVSTFNRRVSA